MFSSNKAQKSSADDGGASDPKDLNLLYPAKSVSYAAVLLRQNVSEEDQGIFHPAPASSERCNPPSVHSLRAPDSLVCSDWVRSSNRSASSLLYVHPFAHPSARSVNPEYLSSSYWTSSSTPLVILSPPDDLPPRPPSSASFIKMGKRSKSRSQGISSQDQDSGHRWGRSVSDGLPQMIQQARKSGSRLWRSLTRPSSTSSPANTKDSGKNSPLPIPARNGSSEVPAERPSLHLEQLPPRPAPYFYPRHVVPTSPTSKQVPVILYPSSYNPGCRSSTVAADAPSANDSGYGGEEDGASNPSVDTAEIGSWKENRKEFIPTITEQEVASQSSLRQRLGTSLVFKPRTNSPSHLRFAHSDMDLRRSNRESARHGGDIGPGVNDDPFAASPIHFRDPFLSPCSSPSLSPPTNRSPLLSVTESLPDLRSGSLTSTLLHPQDHITRGIPRSAPSTPIETSFPIQIPSSCPEWDRFQDSSTPLAQHASLPCSPDETPLLTPDRPSFLPGRRGEMVSWDIDQTPSSTRTRLSFPGLESSDNFFDQYEENALEEGTSRDAGFYEGLPNIASIPFGFASRYSDPRASLPGHRRFPVDPAVHEDDLDIHTDNVEIDDVFTVDPDLTSLTEDWPLPPRRTLFLESTPGMSWHRVSPKVEYFKPGCSDTSYRRVRVVGGRTVSPIAESQVDTLSRLLEHEPQSSPPTQRSASPVGSVVAVLGDSILDNAGFPSIIVLSPSSDSYPSVTLSVRAASLPGLVSFCAFHAETIVTASPISYQHGPAEAHVAISHEEQGSMMGDVLTISVGFQTLPPQSNSTSSLDSFGSPNAFPMSLPMTLGELSVAIAKKSFVLDEINVNPRNSRHTVLSQIS